MAEETAGRWTPEVERKEEEEEIPRTIASTTVRGAHAGSDADDAVWAGPTMYIWPGKFAKERIV